MRTSYKVAWAGFVGAVVFGLTALLCGAKYWLLGFPSGFAAGYAGYEFRAFLRAVPVAAREAFKLTGSVFGRIWAAVSSYFGEKHPFVYLSAVSWAGVAVWSTLLKVREVPVFWLLYFLTAVAMFATAFVFSVLGEIGIHIRAKVRGMLFGHNHKEREQTKALINAFQDFNYDYGQAYECLAWFVLGAVPLLVAFTAWVLYEFACFLCRLAVRVHSDLRLLCGIDGALGGSIAYLTMAAHADSSADKVLLVLCGGVLGAVFAAGSYTLLRALRVFGSVRTEA